MRWYRTLVVTIAALTAYPLSANASLPGFGSGDSGGSTAPPSATCVFGDPCSGDFVEHPADSAYLDDCGRGYLLDEACALNPFDQNLCPVQDLCAGYTKFELAGTPFVDECGSIFNVDDNCGVTALVCLYTDRCNGARTSVVPGSVFSDSCGDEFFVYDNCSTVDPETPPTNPGLEWACGSPCGDWDWDCDGTADCGVWDWNCDVDGVYDDPSDDHVPLSSGCGLDLECLIGLADTPEVPQEECTSVVCVEYDYSVDVDVEYDMEYAVEGDGYGYGRTVSYDYGYSTDYNFTYLVGPDGTIFLDRDLDHIHGYDIDVGGYGYGRGYGYGYGYEADHFYDLDIGHTVIIYPDGSVDIDYDAEIDYCIDIDIARFGYAHGNGYGYSHGITVDHHVDIDYDVELEPGSADISHVIDIDHDVCLYGWHSWGTNWGWDSQWAERCTDQYDPDDCSVFDWTCGVDPADPCELFDWACGVEIHGEHGGGLSWVWDWSIDIDVRRVISIDVDRGQCCIGDRCEPMHDGDCERAFAEPLSSNVAAPQELQFAAGYRTDGVRGFVQRLTPGAQAMVYLGDEAFGGVCDADHPYICDISSPEPVLTVRADAAGMAAFALPTGTDVVGKVLQVVERRQNGHVVSNVERLRSFDGNARLRWVHADSTDIPVRVAVDGVISSNVISAQGHVDLDLEPGEHLIELYEAGSQSLLSSQTVTVGAENAYTAVSSDVLGELVPLREEWGAVDATAARVRFVTDLDQPVMLDHDLDGVADVAIDALVDARDDFGTRMFAGVDNTIGVQVGSGAIERFTLPATAPGEELIVMVSGDTSLHPSGPNGLHLTLVNRGGDSFTLKPDPVVFMLATAPTASLSIGEQSVSTTLGQVSPALWGHEGTNDLSLDGAAADAVALERGERYLAVPLRGGEIMVVPEPRGAGTRMTMAHVGPRGGAMDIGGISASGTFRPGIEGLGYATATRDGGMAVSAGSYRIGVAPTGTTQVSGVFDVELEPGSRSFFLLVDDASRMVQVRTDAGMWTTELL